MNVLVYSLSFLPALGGLERNTVTLCLALKELGHKVHLFTETPAEEADDYPFNVTRSRSMRVFARLVRDSGMLIVNGGVSLRTLPFALLWRKKYVVIYHTFLGWKREGEGIANRWDNRFRKEVAERASANVFTGSHAKEQSGINNSPSYLIFNPVDERLEELHRRMESGGAVRDESSESRRSLLFAGRIIPGKGVFVLMDALRRLDGKMSFDVVFAGAGEAVRELKSRSAYLSSIAVRFPGRLDDEALVRAYREATALVVPTSTHNEGNPLVIAESLYAGTPVIASDQPPMTEAVGDAGLIFESGDDSELAALLEQVFSSEETRRRLQENASRRGRLFSYDAYLDQIERVVGRGSALRS